MLLRRENQGPHKRSLLSGAFIDIPSSSESLSWLCSVYTVISPLKAFFISVTALFIPSIYFWFFLRIFFSLLPLSICFCMLSTLSINSLSIEISFILNSLSDISNIPAMAGSDACSVSSNCGFCILVCLDSLTGCTR